MGADRSPAPFELDLADAAAAVREGRIRAADLVDDALARIDRLDGDLHAFLEVHADAARETARDVDRRVAAGEDVGPLGGVPIGIKDNLCVRGVRTTCGSRFLAEHRPPYDAAVIERLRAAGAVLIGKTNLDEFAMGSSTENSAFGPTRNPFDRDRAPGGSSGGSAAAVAAGLCHGALGSDTGGSIRQPASFCGITGLKPTYGRVSRYGMVAFGSSLDQIGPFARSARDCALLLEAIAGHDERDATSSPAAAFSAADVRDDGPAGLRIGVPDEYFGEGIEDDVGEVIRRALAVLEEAGAELVRLSLPNTKHAIPVYYIVATSEASANLARFDGVGYGRRAPDVSTVDALFERSRSQGFGDEVKRRIILGTWCLSSGWYDAYYDKAMRVRTLIARDFAEAFRRCDLVLGPTSPVAPFRFGERADDPLAMYLADVLTAPAPLAGLPAASVPAGTVVRDGVTLPVGLQIIGDRFQEARILSLATAWERLSGLERKVAGA